VLRACDMFSETEVKLYPASLIAARSVPFTKLEKKTSPGRIRLIRNERIRVQGNLEIILLYLHGLGFFDLSGCRLNPQALGFSRVRPIDQWGPRRIRQLIETWESNVAWLLSRLAQFAASAYIEMFRTGKAKPTTASLSLGWIGWDIMYRVYPVYRRNQWMDQADNPSVTKARHFPAFQSHYRNNASEKEFREFARCLLSLATVISIFHPAGEPNVDEIERWLARAFVRGLIN